jgi:hypothetical protein
MRTLRHGEVKQLAQLFTASGKWCSQILTRQLGLSVGILNCWESVFLYTQMKYFVPFSNFSFLFPLCHLLIFKDFDYSDSYALFFTKLLLFVDSIIMKTIPF